MSTRNIPFSIYHSKRKIAVNYTKSAAVGFCSKGLENEFETVMVNEPSVFEPLKFYCIHIQAGLGIFAVVLQLIYLW